jgi:hypothetical protein
MIKMKTNKQQLVILMLLVLPTTLTIVMAGILARFKQQNNPHPHNYSEKKMINNKKLANGVNDNEQSKKVSWWINELDSLGIEKSSSSNKSESKDSQKLEDLTDDIKQSFIHDYKICYSDNIIQR